jgi:zinc transport system substrate-binding protein
MGVFMKKILLCLLFTIAGFALICCLGSCTAKKNAESQKADGKINVTVALFASYDFVREIAGDRVNLALLLPPGAESHSFEPTPRDIIAIQNSDVFIYTGGESDVWVERILESMDTGKMAILSLMECVDVVEEEIVEGLEEEEEDPLLALGIELEPEYDEHVWTSPVNAVLIVRAITDMLCEVDGENAAYYRQNSDEYTAKLNELDAAFREVVASAQRKTIVFGDRFPFRYFADAYGLSYYAAFPGCSTETEPSAATVAFLMDKIKNEGIPVVFHIELSNERMADAISEETGAKKLLLHACHNISKTDFEKGVSYLDLMNKNVENLKEALR